MGQPFDIKDTPKRLLSIDAFRALNMLLMIFVNDLSGVSGMPDWIDHAKEFEDHLGFADTIFPAFLFIVGLSIPLAIGRKIQRGASFQSLAVPILSRSFALIVMGFFHVNFEDYSAASVLPAPVWEILITIAFFLIWLDYSPDLSKVKRYLLIGTGWAILIVMAFLFKGEGRHGHLHGMRPSWWGILGIIGWSYLVCAGLFLIFKGKIWPMIAVLAAFLAVNILEHGFHIFLHLPEINDCSSTVLVAAGVVISLWYAKWTTNGIDKRLWLSFFIVGVLAIAAGLLIRPYSGGISKIRSTPAWVLICTGISILMFEVMIYLVDLKGKKNWFRLIWPAGTSTLTCYLIPYLMVGLFSLIDFNYPHFMNHGIGGFFRSWLVGFVVIMIGGFLEKRRLKLKI